MFRSLTTLRPAALAKRYEALIFDKDGTLLDFAATWDRGIAEALSRVAADKRRLAAEALGFDLDAGRALRDAACVHLPNEVLVTMLEPITDARALLNDAAATAAKHATAAAHADDVLRALRDNSIPVAVATNDDEQPARNALRALGWLDADRPLVQAVFGCDSGFGGKPEPGMLHAAADALGVPAESCAYVGDAAGDMVASRRAGFAAAILVGGAEVDAHAPLADVRIRDLGELI